MTRSATASSSRSRTSRSPRSASATGAGRRVEHVGPAAQLRHAHEQLGVAGARGPARDLALEADEVLRRELVSSALAVLLVDAEAGQQRRVQRRRRRGRRGSPRRPTASSAWHSTVSASAVPGGAGRADELDARPAGTRASGRGAGVTCAVGVGDVAEAQRRLGRLVARGHDARDRHRHVRAQREHVAVVVEHAVGRLHAAVAAAQDVDSYSIAACRPRRSRGARRRRAGRR